jgi:phosphoglycerol transferase MdoB-like AlkP superfamily enzyme
MLGAEGYHCAFFHGAPNTTLGFKGFTNSIGFTEYYGMDEYNDDSEFDCTWSIWDEPFFLYFAHESDRIAKQGKPFLLTIFSASSHNPFKVPEKYDDGRFPDGTIPMHKAVRYADYSLKKYFEEVSQYDWYKNTIFVFTADHTGPGSRDEYANEYGKFRIPIFFYTPGGQLPIKCDSTRLMQQMDITPTLLSMIGYDKPYFSFGKNVFEQDSTKFVNYVFNDLNGQSMYYLDTLMIEYKNNELTGIFEYQKDYQLKNNLIDRRADFPQLPFMESQIKAIMQEYVEGMKQNTLTAQRYIAK